MEGWSLEMWLVYLVVNWSMSCAFVAMAIGVRVMRAWQSQHQSISSLSQVMMVAAGAHHFIHPMALWFLDGSLTFAVLVISDTFAASLAVLTAVRMFDYRGQ